MSKQETVQLHSAHPIPRMLDPSPKYMYFFNSTPLPVQISAWVTDSNTMSHGVVKPYEKCLVHNSVGEWHLDSMFENRENWTQIEGLEDHLVLGKFRSRACVSGDYAWIYPPFDSLYSVARDGVGLITLLLLSDTLNYEPRVKRRRRCVDADPPPP